MQSENLQKNVIFLDLKLSTTFLSTSWCNSGVGKCDNNATCNCSRELLLILNTIRKIDNRMQESSKELEWMPQFNIFDQNTGRSKIRR